MNTERLGPLLEGEARQGQVMGLAQHIQSLTALPLERCEFLTVLIIRAVHGNADAMQHFSALAACFRPRRSTTRAQEAGLNPHQILRDASAVSGPHINTHSEEECK